MALVQKIAVITHRRSDATNEALMQVLKLCRELGIEAVIPKSEVDKYPEAGGGPATVVADLDQTEVDLGIALGGDGTILRAFSRFPGLATPIMGINFGRVGFLAAMGPGGIPSRLAAMLKGDYQIIDLTLLQLSSGGSNHLAVNDVVVHKPDGGSVINLGYAVNGIEIDRFACDGLVLSTPAGSTAYNLSAGGPLVSLELNAFILTPIAPHTLRNRPLVMGPNDTVTVSNESVGARAAIYVDGRRETEAAPGGGITVKVSDSKAKLVQTAGSGFYQRLREKFIKPGPGR